MIVTFGRTQRLLTESFLPYNPLITYTVLLSTALSPRQPQYTNVEPAFNAASK